METLLAVIVIVVVAVGVCVALHHIRPILFWQEHEDPDDGVPPEILGRIHGVDLTDHSSWR